MVQFVIIWYLVFAATLFVLECYRFFKDGYNEEN